MINREIKILIEMIRGNKDSYSSEEIQSFLNLKFSEGIYPYLRRIKEFTIKGKRGEYSIKTHHEKIIDLKRIVSIYKENTELLLDTKTKKILLRFEQKDNLKKRNLSKKDYSLIMEIFNKTHIIQKIVERSDTIFVLLSYEEPVKSLLNFLEINLKYRSDEVKLNLQKYFSNIPNTNIPASAEEQKELRRINVEYYLLNNDFILDKLSETEFKFLSVSDILTKEKKNEFNNPFEFTTKLDNWKLQYVFNTDRIEGNALTIEEVKNILTVGGEMGSVSSEMKKQVFETMNSRTALERIFNTNNELTEDFIKKLHLAIQNGISPQAGNYKGKENCIQDNEGNLLDKTTPSEFVNERMSKLFSWYNNNNKGELHPFVLASVFHNQFVYIHPFDDGNGRIARLTFNFILIKNGYFPIIFYNHDKEEYYAMLRNSKRGNIKGFVSYALTLYRNQIEEF